MSKHHPPIFRPGESSEKSFAAKTLSVDMDARTVKHFITVPTVDSDGDVLLPKGADLSRFKKSKTIFDCHSYASKSVVGTCVNLSMQDDGITALTRFSPRPPSLPADQEWWPDTLLWLYNIGDIKGWSVGFTIMQARNPTPQDKSQYGDDLQRVITKWLLLEYSVAPLPANGDALTLSTRGLLSVGLAEILSKGGRPTAQRQPAPPLDKVRIEIPPEPVVRKHVVIFMPAERPVVAPAPAGDSVEKTIVMATEISVRKARGQIYA